MGNAHENRGMNHETRRRSLAKALTYRLLVIIADTIVVFFITHRYDVTIAVVVLTNIASTVLYFFHERLWSRVGWGESK